MTIARAQLRRRGVIVSCACIALLSSPFVHQVAARAIVESPGGVVLDASGGLHPFGGLSLQTSGAATWPGRDMARSLEVLSDGSGGWVLDAFGAAHPFGSAPALSGTPSWTNWDIARALVVLPDQHSGYVLDGWGGIHSFGGAPALPGSPPYWEGEDRARGLDVHLNSSGVPDGGAVLDAYGTVHTFGTYPYPVHSADVYPGKPVFQALHDRDGHLYAVGKFGFVTEETAGAAMTPSWSGYTDFGQQDLIRDVVLTSATDGSGSTQPMSAMARYAWSAATGPRGGVMLDGWGGLHGFGGLQCDTAHAPYWPGWDIARAVALLPDGSGGWTLDGWGAAHPFGAANGLVGLPHWPGLDIARALVVNPDRHSGYVLDGWGGIHAFGGAPRLQGSPYWPGWDVARGLSVHYANGGMPDGGWVLDAWGGIHAFGAAPAVASPQVWSGRNLYMQLHTAYDGRAYAIARWGELSDLSGGHIHPYWNGYQDSGGWDMVRDIVLAGDDDPSAAAQPVSSAATAAWWAHVWVYSFDVGPVQQGLPLDCEAAAMQEATRALGREVSQYSIFARLPNYDKGAAQMQSNGVFIARWGDPFEEFVGNVDSCLPCHPSTGYGVYAPPLVADAQSFGFNAAEVDNAGANVVFTALAEGHPVVIITSDTFTPVPTYWYTAYDGRPVPYSYYDHAVTVVAEDGIAGTITINDVAVGRMKTFTMAQFAAFWTTYLDMAVVLQ